MYCRSVLVILVVSGALGTVSGGLGKWLNLLGDAIQHGAQAVCVFAGDHQNSEKSATHVTFYNA